MSYTKAGVADQIMLLPQLRGKASTTADGDWFEMLGQWVHIASTTNASATQTIFSGLSSVSANDDIEVHGNWVFDEGKDTFVLMASRIEKLSTPADPVLVSGMVKEREGNRLKLSGLSGEKAVTLLSSKNLPTSISVDSLVSAWIAKNEVEQGSRTGWSSLRVVDTNPEIDTSQRLVMGAQVSKRDLAAGKLMVQGLLVNLPEVLRNESPPLGSMVQMEILRDGNGWRAVSIKQRQQDKDMGAVVEIRGLIDWPANPQQTFASGFALRDVPINGLLEKIMTDNQCNQFNEGDRIYLNLTAHRPSIRGAPLQVMQLTCTFQSPNPNVIRVTGPIKSLTSPEAMSGELSMMVPGRFGEPLRLIWGPNVNRPTGLDVGTLIQVDYRSLPGTNLIQQIRKLN